MITGKKALKYSKFSVRKMLCLENGHSYKENHGKLRKKNASLKMYFFPFLASFCCTTSPCRIQASVSLNKAKFNALT